MRVIGKFAPIPSDCYLWRYNKDGPRLAIDTDDTRIVHEWLLGPGRRRRLPEIDLPRKRSSLIDLFGEECAKATGSQGVRREVSNADDALRRQRAHVAIARWRRLESPVVGCAQASRDGGGCPRSG